MSLCSPWRVLPPWLLCIALWAPARAETPPLPSGVVLLEQGRVRLQSLIQPGDTVSADLEALGLVHPNARQTLRGVRAGAIARRTAAQGLSNRRFYRNPRVACAAYVSWVLRQSGVRRGSNSATALYHAVRRQGGTVVATRVSTRYTRYFPYYKAGDVLFFWKSSRRIGHTEIYVGSGLTAGTSSSAGRIGIRNLGNRGFRTMTVVRL